MRHVDIGGWKTEQAAIFIAVLYHAFNGKGSGQQAGRRGAVARPQGIADAAGGNDAVVVHHGSHRRRVQAVVRSQLAQDLYVAATAFAKGEILTRYHTTQPEPLHEQFDNEILGGGRGQGGVKIKDQHRIRARHFEKPLPLVEGRQPEPWRFRGKETHRVRIEGRDNGGLSGCSGLCNRLARYGLMAQMEAVKIAQRHNGTTQGIRHGIMGGQAFYGHGVAGNSAKGFSPALMTRSAFSPITARISSAVKPSSSRACVTCSNWDVSKRTVVAPS